jgi:transposase-like protein
MSDPDLSPGLTQRQAVRLLATQLRAGDKRALARVVVLLQRHPIREVAERLGVHIVTLKQWRAELPALRVERKHHKPGRSPSREPAPPVPTKPPPELASPVEPVPTIDPIAELQAAYASGDSARITRAEAAL